MTKGIKNIQFSFGNNDLTRFGGLFLIHAFCKKLRLKPCLQTYIKFTQQNQKYQTAEFIVLLIYTIILGIGRIENIRFTNQWCFQKDNGYTKAAKHNSDKAFSKPAY